MLKLHLIAACNDNGDNLDLLVWAEDKDQALSLWANYYEESGLDPDDDPRVFEVGGVDRPDGMGAQPLGWGDDVVELP